MANSEFAPIAILVTAQYQFGPMAQQSMIAVSLIAYNLAPGSRYMHCQVNHLPDSENSLLI
ncbi:hypothetical protein BIY21_16790 [Vibrio ponticus]|uniref:Uncharacterized protein n=1 Tax=Vibrio ponticus TaxID=265668 RepID=A0A3N3E401_9VIBR|nr:hypothetical protein BIY21_16790 [Vibrio ponticus]ROV60132.1 hypothetical protein EGH82_10660 [Vibrio ponticus]ROV61467.1 hypothetical protein EGH82_04695 [Vibrio ponticus]